MATQSRHPNQVLILVNVTFNLAGPQYSYLAFSDHSPADKVIVNPGDQVGWFVRVQGSPSWTTPAYTLTFNDPTIFGTSSISVPSGGPSGFFTALPLSTPLTKYSLAVSGVLPISDPQIQVNPNPQLDITATATPKQFKIRWTVSSNKMEIPDGSGGWMDFPAGGLTISYSDLVRFCAVLTTAPPNFEIVFPIDLNTTPGVVFASPFDVSKNIFPATTFGLNQATDNLPVTDGTDKSGTVFQFQAVLTDGTNPSNPFKLILS